MPLVINEHQTVLLEEAVAQLVVRPKGVYVDGTFGRGGHTRRILQALDTKSRVIGFDKDPLAVAAGKELAKADSRFHIVHDAFVNMAERMAGLGIDSLDGVLLDLGVSSPQLDDAGRGFSFMQDGPLDMRMNTESGMSAAEWVASAGEPEIVRVLREYGEERFARRMACAIVKARQDAPIVTTGQLAKIVAEANPAWEKGKHPATRAFQAIRIEVNRELVDLEASLLAMTRLLNRGGRLVVISFHSLEDRIVKRFMRNLVKGPQLPRGVPVQASALETGYRLVGKAVKPSRQEIENNPRARSAIMRTLEKVAS
ncbi:MAG: 16S rRNA (cytosine(1402)-N(4))-methyltransferase [Proteobacteria bacterium]|nr:MAG: 16S rRNA (cytosine(1402)-N(4))-methyltransferase [Pseudomonadota bacterium]